jgi:DNA-binding beta-propeller fold protein YncE
MRAMYKRMVSSQFLPLILFPGLVLAADSDFVNFETPQVNPMALSPDESTLAVCHTADNRVLLFTLRSGTPIASTTIPVGLDPVSLRFQNNSEIWVVNQISDSISIIDLEQGIVVRTLQTMDEPADIVFAGNPQKAYISCSQANTIQVFDPADLDAAPVALAILGEDPRALAVSPDGSKVYVAIFESGNGTTILGGGTDESDETIGFPPKIVSHVSGPYAGQNPPPNQGSNFFPAQNTGNAPPPQVGLIVRKNNAGAWMDDNNGDWTAFVSGGDAAMSGRPVGWDLLDNDLAIINTADHQISYVEGLMNACMNVAVNPATGLIGVIGTDALNEIRYEPVLNGVFLRVQLSLIDPQQAFLAETIDLNSHLDYQNSSTSMAERGKSIGDPRAIVWSQDGTHAYVSGMGSDNIVVVNALGDRSAPSDGIPVGEGPTGMALDENRNQLYVLNRFASSLSVINLDMHQVTDTIDFFDPTPEAIRQGRKHLYSTTLNSGLGHVSCASCHLDSRMDRLAWDLGDPAGEIKTLSGVHNLGAGIPGLNEDFTDFHPMKGPMTTQTLQDIIGKEPHHWRGDRDGLEAFNGTFVSLLGKSAMLSTQEMQDFEDFLATIHFPPNPHRALDNSLPTDMALPGQYTSGRFAAPGLPLPNGNALRALNDIYRSEQRLIDDGALACATCHSLPLGMGSDTSLSMFQFQSIPAGPNGERHHALVSVDGSTQRTFKIPQLRNMYDKVGFETTQQTSLTGFGFFHDGSVDSLARFMSGTTFDVVSDQEVADLVALMMSFSGSSFPGNAGFIEPPGTASQDAHAAVGQQVTLLNSDSNETLNSLIVLADVGAIELVAKGTVAGAARAWLFAGSGIFTSDRAGESISTASLYSIADTAPLTFTAVPNGSGIRIGIDRDRDDMLDRDEVRIFTAGVPNPFDPDDPDKVGDNKSFAPDGIPDGANDFDGDGVSNADELMAGTNPADHLVPVTVTFVHGAGGPAYQLEWNAEPGARYRIQYSKDLIDWTIANTVVVASQQAVALTWLDEGPPQTLESPTALEQRFYRVYFD